MHTVGPPSAAGTMAWGTHPELVGPRHRYRVVLMARLLAAHLPPGPTPGARVLDAGAGRGTLARLLARRGYRVTALEEAAGFLAFLRTCASGRLGLVQGDVTALPFAAGSFAGVVCGEVLEHVPDDRAAVQELARVLRPGGVLVATVPAGRARYGWLDRWAGHVRRYERADLCALLEAHGFQVLRLHHWGFPFGLLYERLVQRPVLAQHARHGAAPAVALHLGGARLTSGVAGALFRLDHLCDAAPWGPGLLVVARRAVQ